MMSAQPNELGRFNLALAEPAVASGGARQMREEDGRLERAPSSFGIVRNEQPGIVVPLKLARLPANHEGRHRNLTLVHSELPIPTIRQLESGLLTFVFDKGRRNNFLKINDNFDERLAA